ncbi:unnamed protein product [Closterium sp. Yama58-4]|nr:unnamed protein product [Closterium sp. Yama58-4]
MSRALRTYSILRYLSSIAGSSFRDNSGIAVATPAGFALFKVLDDKKLDKVEDIWTHFESPESASKVVKLKAFDKFENTADALGAATALVESKLSKGLKKFVKAQCQGETLAVADSKLGNIIKEKLGVTCVHSAAVMELMRGVRSHLSELIAGLSGADLAPMSLGLSHSLSRYKLKFSPDKVDTMIVQAIGLLDDLDKELNTYAMRVREWYGWHFPELAKIVTDNLQYARAVKLMAHRVNAADLDFSGILEEEVESAMKEAAVISMGTEVSEHDMTNIIALCDQVIALSEYRAQLFDYLRSRMLAIAPNLTVLVGELVGARLIAHAGSLMSLAKHPASTVQILGAEKALFRALKTKHDTPKYGLIFHASLIGQAPPKLKGKISRVLAAKCSLAIRVDALGDATEPTVGIEGRAKIEQRLRQLEGRVLGSASAASKGKAKLGPYDKDRKEGTGGLITPAKAYNPASDALLTAKSPATDATPATAEESGKKAKKEKKAKKDKENGEATPSATARVDADGAEPPSTETAGMATRARISSSRVPLPVSAIAVAFLFHTVFSLLSHSLPASAARVPASTHLLMTSSEGPDFKILENRQQVTITKGSSVDAGESAGSQSDTKAEGPPRPPVWPPRFQVDFNEEMYLPWYTLTTDGTWRYDYTTRRQRIDRRNGLGDRYCGSALPLRTTPCTQLVRDSWRYLVFPKEKYCCRCCSAANGCDVVRPDWLANATYMGRDYMDDVPSTKWKQQGLQNNYYWHSEDDVPMRIYMEPLEQMTFLHASFQKPHTFPSATFDLPSDMDCSQLCYGFCALVRQTTL